MAPAWPTSPNGFSFLHKLSRRYARISSPKSISWNRGIGVARYRDIALSRYHGVVVLQQCRTKISRDDDRVMLNRCKILLAQYRDCSQDHITTSYSADTMKKNRDADDLAARIAAAASQPPAILAMPEPSPEVPAVSFGIAKNEQNPEPLHKQSGKKHLDIDTVPISLRPHRALLNRYIIAASERTREEGRVISAQQIMLEVLERSGV